MYLRFQNQLPLIYTKSGSTCSPLLNETSESIIITADLMFSGTVILPITGQLTFHVSHFVIRRPFVDRAEYYRRLLILLDCSSNDIV